MHLMIGTSRIPWGRTVGLALLVAAAIGLAAPSEVGATPALMNYQGFITDGNNNPLSGAFPMSFKLFPDSTTGSPLWSESYGSVTVAAGVFNVVLGGGAPLPLAAFSGTKLWLLTTVNGVDVLPRRPIVAVAYAFRSDVADSALRVTASVGEIAGQVHN